MTDPTLRAGFDATLETAINTALKYDPGTSARLSKLQGRVLAVQLSAPQLRMYLVIEHERVEVHGQWAGEVTTELSGSALAFFQLLRDSHATPAKLGVSVVGSSAFLAELQTILRDLDIDWEEPLAKLLGDSPAHQIGKSLRAASSWLGHVIGGAPKASAEAVSEEWRFTPPRAQFEAFVQDLSELNMGTERFEAKLNLLREKLVQREHK